MYGPVLASDVYYLPLCFALTFARACVHTCFRCIVVCTSYFHASLFFPLTTIPLPSLVIFMKPRYVFSWHNYEVHASWIELIEWFRLFWRCSNCKNLRFAVWEAFLFGRLDGHWAIHYNKLCLIMYPYELVPWFSPPGKTVLFACATFKPSWFS